MDDYLGGGGRLDALLPQGFYGVGFQPIPI